MDILDELTLREDKDRISQMSVEDMMQEVYAPKYKLPCLAYEVAEIYDTQGIYQFLTKADRITEKLYESPEENKIVVKNFDTNQQVTINIGDIKAQENSDTLMDHTAMIAYNRLADLKVELWVYASTLIDIGKKYTYTLDKKGKIQFVDDDKIGAYLAAVILSHCKWTQSEAMPIVTALYEYKKYCKNKSYDMEAKKMEVINYVLSHSHSHLAAKGEWAGAQFESFIKSLKVCDEALSKHEIKQNKDIIDEMAKRYFGNAQKLTRQEWIEAK